MATTDTKFNRITALETAQGSGELESSQAVDVERLRGRGMIEIRPCATSTTPFLYESNQGIAAEKAHEVSGSDGLLA